jgi:tetratricopeptide (TPR) repeat protein
MLEPIRQFAARRLDSVDYSERHAMKDAHCRYFSGLANQAQGALSGRRQGHWFVSLEWDYPNLEAAIEYLLDTPAHAGRALQMIVQLDRFWHNRGRLPQCAALLRRAIDMAEHEALVELRCDGLRLAGDAVLDGDLAAAAAYYRAALTAAQTRNDDYHVAHALARLAQVHYREDDRSAAATAGRQSVEIARRVGEPVLLAECLIYFGVALITGHLDVYRQIHEEAIAVTRRSGDLTHLGWAHNNYGNGLLAHGELSEAHHHLKLSQAVFADIGTPNPTPLVNLGWVNLLQDDLDAAREVFIAALIVANRHQLRFGGALAILGLGCAAVGTRDYERAATMIGFADAEFETFGSHAWPDPEASYRARSIEAITQAIGSGFDDSYEFGHINDRHKLMTFALDQTWRQDGTSGR